MSGPRWSVDRRERPGPSRTAKAWLAVAASLGWSAAACSVAEATPLPHCADGDSMMLVAQSAPAAQALPCFEALPPGWAASGVTIDDGGTVIDFDHDRLGPGAAELRFTDRCRPDDGSPPPTVTADTGPSTTAGDGWVLHRYPIAGGCLDIRYQIEASIPEERTAEWADELEAALRFVDRAPLDDLVRRRFEADGV